MAFIGTAVYDIYTNEIGEDVSPIVSLISPSLTRFLDDVGDQGIPITSKYYNWEEKSLLPDTYAFSSNVASSAAASGGLEVGANATYIRVGDVFEINTSKEQVRVSSLGASAATIYVTRAYAGTTANSGAAGTDELVFRGSAVEEGSDPRLSRRVGKTLKGNYVQQFREDINISKLANKSGFKVPNAPEPFSEEVADKTKDILKQLEKTVLMGRTNGNTIGADDTETTMAGIYYSIATNITSHATYSDSILNVMLRQINNYTDLQAESDKYALYMGTRVYGALSAARSGRVQTGAADNISGIGRPEIYLSDFGPMPIKAIRWLPQGDVLAIRKDFVKVKPYAGNSFASNTYNDGASAIKGYVEGTYGVEFHQEASHGALKGIGGNY